MILVDDVSSDNSVEVAKNWLQNNSSRFNRVVLAKNHENSGLALTRNVAFTLAETPFVLPLDSDNELLPDCAQKCLSVIHEHHAAFAYPMIEKFGEAQGIMGGTPYQPTFFIVTNYIDAMALIRKAAWAAVGGYHVMRLGLEDYD